MFRIGCLEWQKLEDTEAEDAGGVNIALQFFPKLFAGKFFLPQGQAAMDALAAHAAVGSIPQWATHTGKESTAKLA